MAFISPRRSLSPDGTAVLPEHPLEVLYRSPSADGTAIFDGGGTGLATERRGLSARASSAEGTLTYLCASGKASGKSTAPQVAPPSSVRHVPRAPVRTLASSQGSQGYFAPRRPRRPSVRKSSVVRVGPPPFTGRVDVSGAAAVEAPVQSSPDMSFLVERRFLRRMRKRTTPSESGCPVRHRRTLPVLNMWHRPRKAVNRELHALNGNTSSSVSTPILPVQGLDPAGPTVRDENPQEEILWTCPSRLRLQRERAKKGTAVDKKPLMSLMARGR